MYINRNILPKLFECCNDIPVHLTLTQNRIVEDNPFDDAAVLVEIKVSYDSADKQLFDDALNEAIRLTYNLPES